MSVYGYTFIKEIEKFNLDSYTGHLGWISANPISFKIYTQTQSLHFYLHDEQKDRLFEFVALDLKKLTTKEKYEKVIKEYFLAYPLH